jgi:hypothetical protein
MEKQAVKDLREKIQKVLNDAKIEGFVLKVGNATYGETSAMFKLEASKIGDNDEVQDRSAENFKRMALLYGLNPEDLGKTFTTAQQTYTIVGLNPKSRKFPVIAKRSDGKTFKFPIDVIRLKLGPWPVGYSKSDMEWRLEKPRRTPATEMAPDLI